MATKKFLHDIDLQQVGQLKGARIENVTSTELTTLAGTLGAANRGLVVYNTTNSSLYTWNGASFDQYTFEVTGDIRFKGAIDATSSASVVPASGDQYVVDSAGTLSTQSGAITYTPSANVEPGDVVLFTSATTAVVIQRNLEQATETTLGSIRLSSQAEVDAGVVADEAVTPSTLHGYVNPEFAADRARLSTNETAISTLQSDLAQEVIDRAADVDAEETRALAAEAGLATDITAEETRALAAEGVLQGNIDAEATTRAAADTTLQSNIDAEATARAAADTTLQSNIDAEASTRAADDATLQTNIDAEETRALAAEGVLQGNIDTEEAARIAADSALDTRVTAVEARDEVFTYAASVDLVADTAFTVSHSLGLSNKDNFTINTMHNGEAVSVQVTSVDTNTIQLTSSVGVTGLRVAVIGF